jgi:hypothetical protein
MLCRLPKLRRQRATTSDCGTTDSVDYNNLPTGRTFAGLFSIEVGTGDRAGTASPSAPTRKDIIQSGNHSMG